MMNTGFGFRAEPISSTACSLRAARRLHGKVLLPAQLDGHNVVIIDPCDFRYDGATSLVLPEGVGILWHEAFINDCDLTSVTLPDSLRFIGVNPFLNSGVEDIRISPSHRFFGYEGGCLYERCSGRLISVLESCCADVIRLPQGLRSIGSRALEGFDAPHDVLIPPGVHSIGQLAFNGFWQLGRLALPATLRHIGHHAFQGCWLSQPMDLVLPEGLEIIQAYAFNDCGQLHSVTIPASVRKIGECAFLGCAEDFTLHVQHGSYAEEYALKNAIPIACPD